MFPLHLILFKVLSFSIGWVVSMMHASLSESVLLNISFNALASDSSKSSPSCSSTIKFTFSECFSFSNISFMILLKFRPFLLWTGVTLPTLLPC